MTENFLAGGIVQRGELGQAFSGDESLDETLRLGRELRSQSSPLLRRARSECANIARRQSCAGPF